MYYILMMLSLMLSTTFMFMKHPMSMELILLLQTILISLTFGFYSYSYWYSYILFIVTVGGMLVLFMYMTSLASNEMFYFSTNFSIFIIFFIMSSLISILFLDYLMINPLFKNSMMMEMINNSIRYKNDNIMSLKMIYNNPNNTITLLLLVNYLFLTLMAVVKITDINYCILRQKF